MTLWQKARLYFGLKSLLKRLGIPRKERRVIMRKALQWTGWANLGLVLFQVINSVTDTMPVLKANPWIMVVNAVLGAVLPSVGGVSHKLAGTTVVPKENG